MWSSEQLFRDFLVNILAGLFSGTLIFIVGLHWRTMASYLSRDRISFRRIFGVGAYEAGRILVTLDTYKDIRLLPESAQQSLGGVTHPQSGGHRYYKAFPDHWTAFPGPTGEVLGYCSARGSAYLIDRIGGIGGVSVRVVQDQEVAHQWEGTYINLGSSYSNIKTDDVKHLPENPWLLNDGGELTFKDGSKFKLEQRSDKAIIMKLTNPYFSKYSVLVCAGLGEWGTSGSAWYLSTHWRQLSNRFGDQPFLLVVSVTPGSDESAREIRAYGNETLSWRVRSSLRRFLTPIVKVDDQKSDPAKT